MLVHGAWHGGWCWRRVIPHLRAAGHEAYPVTLTGLGERAHLLSADIRLSTHIRDVVALIENEELDKTVLVGHSYGGMIITGVADWLLQRDKPKLERLIFLDAITPYPGESWSSQHPKEIIEARAKSAAQSGNASIPPPTPPSTASTAKTATGSTAARPRSRSAFTRIRWTSMPHA